MKIQPHIIHEFDNHKAQLGLHGNMEVQPCKAQAQACKFGGPRCNKFNPYRCLNWVELSSFLSWINLLVIGLGKSTSLFDVGLENQSKKLGTDLKTWLQSL